MSVVIRRDHPSGSVGLSVEAFPDTGTVVLGIGPLEDMKFFSMTAEESGVVEDELFAAAERANGGQ